jgi:hypothetical protein
MPVETGEDILQMSDDDFLSLPVPAADAEANASADAGEGEEDQDNTEGNDEGQPTGEPDANAASRQEKEDESEEDEANQQPEKEPTNKSATTPTPNVDPVGSKPAEQQQPAKEADAAKPEGAEPDYKALYEGLMAPIKANGKTIELRSPEELVKLAQQGANYTRKMQELAPHRKMLLMLENNGLLDEGQLSYLIDLSKKNPEAIKKLVKESGINPLDIDTEAEPAYQQGNHRVTDEEAAFRSTLDDMSAFDGGRQTLQVINSTWDQASKELLFKDPSAMTLIHEQREAGIYDLIAAEIEHQKLVGNVPANVSFIEAYRKVGDWMAQQGKFNDLIAKQNPTQVPSAPVKQPVATTTAQVKPKVAHSDKASAAAQSRTGSKPAKPAINPLAMSDDEFLKQFENRL